MQKSLININNLNTAYIKQIVHHKHLVITSGIKALFNIQKSIKLIHNNNRIKIKTPCDNHKQRQKN